MLQTLSLALLPVLMIVAALSDVASLRIPNWLTGLTAALFFPMAFLTGMPLAEFGWHLLAGAILFFVGYGIFAVGFFGTCYNLEHERQHDGTEATAGHGARAATTGGGLPAA